MTKNKLAIKFDENDDIDSNNISEEYTKEQQQIESNQSKTLQQIRQYTLLLILIISKCFPQNYANAENSTTNQLPNKIDLEKFQKLFPTSELTTSIRKIKQTNQRIAQKKEQLRKTKLKKRLEKLKSAKTWRGEFLKSITYGLVGGAIDFKKLPNQVLQREFEYLTSKGIKNITFMPVMGQSTGNNSSDIELLQNFPGAPDIEDLERIIPLAQENGLSVTIKPYFIKGKKRKIEGYSDQIESNPQWIENYTQQLLKLAKLCEKHGVVLFVIGNELKKVCRNRSFQNSVPNIIQKIKQQYSGKISYAAMPSNWYYRNLPNSFWQNFDYAGVNIWPPGIVSKTATPSISEWQKGFKRSFKKATRLSTRSKNPVIITEIGVKSVDFPRICKKRRCYHRDVVARGVGGSILRRKQNIQAQKNAYEAIFQLITENPNIKGVIPWLITPGSIGVEFPSPVHNIYFTNGFDPKEETYGAISKWLRKTK